MDLHSENSVAIVTSQQVLPVDEFISTPQAAKLSGMHRSSMTLWCHKLGPSFAVQIGRNWKIRTKVFARLLSEGAFNADLNENAA